MTADPALTRGAALRADMQALDRLAQLLTRPDVIASLSPADHLAMLQYVMQQTLATMQAFLAWQHEVQP